VGIHVGPSPKPVLATADGAHPCGYQADELAFFVSMFDHDRMKQDRPGPAPDRLIVAGLMGAAQRHARWGGLNDVEKAAGVTELQELAGDRPGLLAEVAGIQLGTSEGKGEHEQARAEATAELCRLAGTDEALIPRWVAEGKCRAENPGMMPHSGRPRRNRF
jgi:hypothetical protein